MAIYTIPDGVIQDLQVKGSAVLEASADVVGSVGLAGSVTIADASTDTIGFYGTTPTAKLGATDATTILMALGLMAT